MLLQNVIVFTNFLLVFSKNMCTHDEERRAVKKVVPCSLRKTLVPLVKPLELTRIRPDQVLIKRCQGSGVNEPLQARALLELARKIACSKTARLENGSKKFCSKGARLENGSEKLSSKTARLEIGSKNSKHQNIQSLFLCTFIDDFCLILSINT